MNFLLLILAVLGKQQCVMPVSIPEGFRHASVYGKYYMEVWRVVNTPCYKGTGAFWKSISKTKMERAIAITVGKFGNVVRPVFERTLIDVLNSGLVKREAKRGRGKGGRVPKGYPNEKAEKAEKTSSASPEPTNASFV